MIRKLRFRLILTTMIAVFLVLMVLMGGINLSNYRKVVADGDAVLEILMQNGGTFAEYGPGLREGMPSGDPGNSEFPGEIPDLPEPEGFGNGDRRPSGNNGFFRFDDGRINSPELAYETRFFSVLLSSDEQVLRTDTGRIAAVSESTANEYAIRAVRKHKDSGFIGDYRFLVGEKDEKGNRLIIFCDCGASLSNFRNFRTISIVVSAVCLVLVGVLVFFASGRVIRPVAESYEKQKRFITDAGHEIKTPLSIISADADVLEMDLSEENEWLSDIKAQTRRLSELTNDLIFLSKMEEQNTVLEMKDLDLSQLSETQASSFRALAASSKKALSTEIDPDIHIQGDKKSIESLLTIVLDNAVKYCPEGGKIDVQLSKGKRHAHLTVTNDTEEVISEDAVKHLFDRFYRTDASRNSQTGGYGIGLSMAHAIVEKHKGKISAESGKAREKSLTLTILLRLSSTES